MLTSSSKKPRDRKGEFITCYSYKKSLGGFYMRILVVYVYKKLSLVKQSLQSFNVYLPHGLQ